VITTHQFLADVERMDVKVSVSNATRKTIDHLNGHFSEYENAKDTYKELSTVGRIMALVNWLRVMNMNERVELDDFLSVPIPAFTTPSSTRKMLAVSTIAFPKDSPPRAENIRDGTRVLYLSRLLDRHGPNTKDEEFLKTASQFTLDSSGLAFPRQKELKSTIDEYDSLIRETKSKILSLKQDIDRSKDTLDRTSEFEVDRHNSLVERSDSLVQILNTYINKYNEAVKELNDLEIQTRQIASIGGGIDLSPKKFKVISRDVTSPQILKVNGIRSAMSTVGKVARSGDWIRNIVAKGTSRVNLLPKSAWTSSKTINGKIKYSYRSNSGDVISVSSFPESDEWEFNVSINESNDMVKFSKTTNLLQVNHTGFKSEFLGKLSSNGKRVIFSK
jgi:hypothetical protein